MRRSCLQIEPEINRSGRLPPSVAAASPVGAARGYLGRPEITAEGLLHALTAAATVSLPLPTRNGSSIYGPPQVETPVWPFHNPQ
jgi:hypothetical protein